MKERKLRETIEKTADKRLIWHVACSLSLSLSLSLNATLLTRLLSFSSELLHHHLFLNIIFQVKYRRRDLCSI
ncbi:MAG: hypothetical protein HQL06_01370 [Nitrospirae bacterium]|nr:hypothetical protein [Nitrospirota bacterium]